MTKRPRMPAEMVAHVYDCDIERGTLTWRNPGHKRCAAGTPINTMIAKGYVYHQRFNKRYLVQHLVWAWAHGRWPQGTIDHINRDKSDNRLANLREVPLGRNIVNKPVLRHSRSQRKGVKLDMRNGRYYAYLATRNKTIYLGGYATADEAYAARLAAEKEYYGEVLSELQTPVGGSPNATPAEPPE